MQNVTIITAFVAGIISFISTCVLPLVPAYISFVSGISIQQLTQEGYKGRALKGVILNSLLFVAGFSLIFIGLGASATLVGQFLLSKMDLLAKVAGVIIVIFGLHTAGLFKISFLNYERRFQSKKRIGPLGSFAVGLAFAFGWTPCVGPILAGILAIASTQETIGQGIFLLSGYSLGLGIPFILTGVGINRFFVILGKLKKHFRWVEIISGALLVIVGVLIFLGGLQRLTSIF